MNQTLKIGYVIKYFHPIKGGAENNILNLALRAAAAGHEVHVFTADRKGDQVLQKRETIYKGIRIHRARMWFDTSLYLSLYPGLLKSLLKTDLDVIHVSGFGLIWQDIVLILKKLFSSNVRFINTPHGPFMALSQYSFFLKVIRTLYGVLQRLFLNWLYDTVIQVNTFQWRWITGYGIDRAKIEFVPNGIAEEDIIRKIPTSGKKAFLKKYHMDGKTVISCLGRISKYKGFQYMIQVLPRILSEHKGIMLLIMGRDDGYARTLKATAEKLGVSKNVRFVLDVSEDEKYTGLEISEIFVFPSEWEAFGIVLLEAMSRNNAVVTTKTEGGQFLIVDGDNGFLVNFGDTEQLLRSVLHLLSDPKRRAEMQRKNKIKVHHYTWNTVFDRYYKQVLERSR